MTREDFLNLTEEEQAAALQTAADNEKKITDLEAERDSFKNENDKLRADKEAISKELKSTKELNFTLARNMDTSAQKKSAEDILNEMFPSGRKAK